MAEIIQKEILRDKVCEVLRDWILKGKLKPGERIVESALAGEFQVSRAPIREALWLLAHQGLVRIRAHQGAFVTQLSVGDIREVFEIREALESLAARKIRATLTPERSRALKAALSGLEEAAMQKDVSRFSEADLRFHRTLWELAGNRHLEEMLGDISARFFGYELIRDLPRSGAYRYEDMVDEHRKMVRLTLHGTDPQIVAGFHECFGVFLRYVVERFGEEAPAR